MFGMPNLNPVTKTRRLLEELFDPYDAKSIVDWNHNPVPSVLDEVQPMADAGVAASIAPSCGDATCTSTAGWWVSPAGAATPAPRCEAVQEDLMTDTSAMEFGLLMPHFGGHASRRAVLDGAHHPAHHRRAGGHHAGADRGQRPAHADDRGDPAHVDRGHPRSGAVGSEPRRPAGLGQQAGQVVGQAPVGPLRHGHRHRGLAHRRHPDEVVEQVRRFADVGVEHLVFDLRMNFDRWFASVELLGREVLPALRA